MPRGRKAGDHNAKRLAIAESACRAILKIGIAEVSLADIAREMGYTTGVLRHYFADKDELLLFAKNAMFDRAYENAQRAGAGLPGAERLRAMAFELLPLDTTSIERDRLLATFNGRAIGSPKLMQLQHERNQRFWALFEREIEALRTSGVFSPRTNARLEACGIVAFSDGLAEQVIMNPQHWRSAEIAELMSRYMDAVLARNAPHAPAGAARVDRRKRTEVRMPAPTGAASRRRHRTQRAGGSR